MLIPTKNELSSCGVVEPPWLVDSVLEKMQDQVLSALESSDTDSLERIRQRYRSNG